MTLEGMQRAMWLASSAAIVALVLVMAVYCLLTLRWVPRRWQPVCDRLRREEVSGRCSWREALAWSLGALAWLWVMMLFSYILRHGSLQGFINYMRYRFVEQGDARNYLYIAEHGYPSEGNERLFVVFYPLFPLCVRVLHSVFRLSYGVAGVALSHFCFALSAGLMRQLAGETLEPGGARMATAAMVLYPFTFYCFGPYTESLYMVLALACLLLLRKGRWWPAGLMALLAALCRTQGFALTFACLYAFLSADRRERGPWTNGLSALGAPVGFCMYLCMNWMNCGDAFRFLTYQREHWYHQTRWFGDNLAEQLAAMVHHENMWETTFLPQIILFFLACGLLIWLFVRKKRSPEGVYSVAFLGMSYLSSWLISGNRYMLGCVGLYLALGMVKNRALRALLLLAEGAALVYMTWRYIGNAPMW